MTRPFVSAATLGTLLLWTMPLLGRSAGVAALGCDICHSGGALPTISLLAEPLNPAVGQAVTLTIAVSQTNGASAGFYLTTAHDAPGTFKALEAGTTATGTAVLHTMPRSGAGGTTVFQAQWTASVPTGVEFDVYALSANGDKSTRGDGAGESQLQLLVGCSGATYYIDQDGDGYGSSDPAYAPRVDCSAPAGYAAVSGDCDDFHADVHPDAMELCDLKDNDCDGSVDEDVVDQLYCEDKDGDGHGVTGGLTKLDCKPNAGFGDCEGDCDDHVAEVHPGAAEVCDGIDNDCNGKTDDGARMVCGVGLCSRYALGCSSNCTPGPPFAETCNLYDDDCDGVVDNGDNASLCGDPNLTCVLGQCTGTPTTVVAGTGGGGAKVNRSDGLQADGSTSACSLVPRGLGRGASPHFVPAVACLWLLRRRRRAQPGS